MSFIKRKDGTPFATEAAAKREISKLENPKNAKIICLGDDEGYVVEVDGEETNVKRKRIPLRERNVLTIEDKYKREDFTYRWVNDTENRIQMFREAGWEPVLDTEQVIEIGDDSVGRESRKGTIVKKSVNEKMDTVLMRLPKDIYDEEQAIKQRELDKSEKAMKRDEQNKEGRYGEIRYGSG